MCDEKETFKNIPFMENRCQFLAKVASLFDVSSHILETTLSSLHVTRRKLKSCATMRQWHLLLEKKDLPLISQKCLPLLFSKFFLIAIKSDIDKLIQLVLSSASHSLFISLNRYSQKYWCRIKI